MLLRDQSAFREVVKVFTVGLALRSYTADGDGGPRRTSFGHELARYICMAANRRRANSRYRLPKMLPQERVKDCDMRSKHRDVQPPCEKSGQFAVKPKLKPDSKL